MAYMAKEASQATPHCMATTPRVFREESSSRRMVATAATQGVYSRVNTRKLRADRVVNRPEIALPPSSRSVWAQP